MAPLARLEHATFWSATKRSNPLSYRGKGDGILMHIERWVKPEFMAFTNRRQTNPSNRKAREDREEIRLNFAFLAFFSVDFSVGVKNFRF